MSSKEGPALSFPRTTPVRPVPPASPYSPTYHSDSASASEFDFDIVSGAPRFFYLPCQLKDPCRDIEGLEMLIEAA